MWYKKYIGLPWVAYATGPDAYDCWGLVVHCLKEYYGLSVDRYQAVVTDDHKGIYRAFQAEIKTDAWIEIEQPVDGAVVMLSTKTRFFHHIGIYIDGRVLHSSDGGQVAVESVPRLRQFGYKQVKFYVHKSILNSTNRPV